MTKDFGPFFLVSSTVTNIREQFIQVNTLFWQLLWNLSELSLRPKRLLKTRSIQKKATSPVKSSFWPILYRFIEHEIVMQHTIRVQRYFDKKFANDKIFPLGPKESIETNNSKNSCFHDEKSFGPFFPHIIECHKHQRTNYKGPQPILAITVEIIRPFFEDLWGHWKHKCVKNKAIFPMKKRRWPLLFCFIEHEKRQGTLYEGPKAVLTLIVQLIKTFIGT